MTPAATTSEIYQLQDDGTWSTAAGPGNPGPDGFVYGVTDPDAINTGIQVPESALTHYATHAPRSGGVYSNSEYAGWVDYRNISNTDYLNCRFIGPTVADNGSAWVTRAGILDFQNAGGVPGSVAGYWGAQGQNRFKFCDFTPAALAAAFNGILRGHHIILDRCTVRGGIDGLDIYNFNGAWVYVELLGCYFADRIAMFPDPWGSHSDGTHSDDIEWTSGRGVRILGTRFAGMASFLGDTGDPNYARPNTYGPSTRNPQANAAIGAYQNLDGGYPIGDLYADQNWYGGGKVGAIGLNPKAGPDPITNIHLTNARFTFTGRTASGMQNWGLNSSKSDGTLDVATLTAGGNDFTGMMGLTASGLWKPIPYSPTTGYRTRPT